MASKQKSKSRNWTSEETHLLVETLTDEEHRFAECLERKALKRSANKEVFQEILKIFKARLKKEDFIEQNRKNFGKISYIYLEVDTKKLQVKYNALKKKWRELRDRPRRGSGLAPEDLPAWCNNLDNVLGDTKTSLEYVVSDPAETSHNQEMFKNEDESDDVTMDGKETYEDIAIPEADNDISAPEEMENASSSKKKVVVKPHQKRKVIRSQTQALSHLAEGIRQMVESQAKRHKATIEFERDRDIKFLEFKKMEAEKNRQHELQIAQIFASAIQSHAVGSSYPPNYYQPTSPYQSSSSCYPNLSSPPVQVRQPLVEQNSPVNLKSYTPSLPRHTFENSEI